MRLNVVCHTLSFVDGKIEPFVSVWDRPRRAETGPHRPSDENRMRSRSIRPAYFLGPEAT
jgi:hypothetical protein